MRIFTILSLAMTITVTSKAQTVARFEDLPLSKPDTSYINYSESGADVGFNDGFAHFPCVYDTSYGGYWDYGFSYSNWTDSVTSGYGNQYSAKTDIGYDGSAQYAVAYCYDPVSNAYSTNLNLTGAAIGQSVFGFYITNSTYAYNSMKYGDMFDTAFHSGDWFLLTVKGYRDSSLTADSVNFYLADYRFADTTMNYIVRTWDWVNLLPLGHVDSLQFTLTGSDTSFGALNIPAYFCMDNFTTNETGEGVSKVSKTMAAKVYPNPATDMLYVDVLDNTLNQITVVDMAGNIVGMYEAAAHTAISTASLPVGTYVLQLSSNGKVANMRFVKE